MTTHAAASFFAGIAAHEHYVRMEKADGVIQFVLAHGNRSDSWSVAIVHGDVTVVHGRPPEPPTCVVRAPRELFERIAAGRTNATAAILRGEVGVEGDLRLLLLFSAAFASPSPSAKPARAELEPA